ncbi:D-aminoacyl-tRNA deacylase [Coniochaeta hoffmannii]|uniref:D-aminoacyl-tRNA deacylase n=1 Tax=Coniochaeta hoffmannii TaxID=91930 RepID=A0AA38R1Y3_9PEZI|nr:D-aminoacyl-tRNA deacylase [Coniochaeta hoffmannii]
MAPATRGWTGAAIDRLFAWSSKLPPESCSYTIERLRIPVDDAVPLLDAVDDYFGGDTPFWLRHAIEHPDSQDERWKPLHQDGALERANIPILLMSGWYDILLPQVMEQYTRLAERGCNVALTVGPWTHLGAQRSNIQEPFDWLDEHFTHSKKDVRTSPVRVFITGTEEWRDLAKWPLPTSPHELFLSSDKKLSAALPPADAAESTFKFDPAHPTPSIGVPSLFDTAVKKESDSPLASRSDVATFTTAPLPEDLEVCGKPTITLHHSSDNPNVDLWVLVSEVDGTGESYSTSEKYLRLDPSQTQQEVLTLGLRDSILQRVLSASVTVDSQLVSSIGRGVLVFAAMAPGDTEKEAESLAAKVLKMRLWDDESGGRWKHSVQDINGEVLCVSQFTLLASTKKGSKPDFHGALGGDEAKRLYDYFFSKVREGYLGKRVKDGVFQAMMEVALVNDGPVTIEINAEPKPKVEKATVKKKEKGAEESFRT